MSSKTGNIKVNTNDIFPIIKKWLYSEHDIFIRELVSNACDAITKRTTLSRTQNRETPAGKVTIEIDSEAKTITFHDNGIGMTEAEVEKYIAQLAFSGAEEFVQKMKDIKSTDAKDEIIGKFGLGFYSSFMVAQKVVIDSLSMNEGAQATKWTCEGDTEYTFSASDKKEVGTSITLYINDDGQDFLQTWKTRQTLRNYCDFMPYPIELIDMVSRRRTEAENAKAKKEEDKKPIEIDIINDCNPLWKKDPSKITDEEYKEFYRKLYPMDQEPLFWLHLNIDHPFNLQGILYFPKINMAKPIQEHSIRLYCRQVFVSDNVKNIMPEFLSMLKGAIDSTDIPLNVSRSALQGDPNIKKISNYIVKKVAESLKKIAKDDRKKYEVSWKDIGLFSKYGVMSDEKFDQILRDYLIFKGADDKFYTLSEYFEAVPANYKEKIKDKVLYFDPETSNLTIVNQVKELGIPVIELDQFIDPHVTQHLEFKKVNDTEVKFSLVEVELENLIETEETTADDIKIKEHFESILKPNDQFEIEMKKSSSENPAYIKIDQTMKRFQQMSKAMGQEANTFPVKKTLVINPAHALIQNAYKLAQDDNKKELSNRLVEHVHELALISGEGLTGEAKENFVKKSHELLKDLTSL